MRKVKLVVDVFKGLELYDIHLIDINSNEKIYSSYDVDMSMVVDGVVELEKSGNLVNVVYVYHDIIGQALNKKEQFFN